jgi:hypothetical protein
VGRGGGDRAALRGLTCLSLLIWGTGYTNAATCGVSKQIPIANL